MSRAAVALAVMGIALAACSKQAATENSANAAVLSPDTNLDAAASLDNELDPSGNGGNAS